MTATGAQLAWWVWPILLFVAAFLMGVVAVVGGIGGGVLFVPIVGGFFPFHVDFVRGASLLLALCGALAAAPSALRSGMASLRLAMPLALVGSVTAIAGAYIGLSLPERVVQGALGVIVLAIAALMWATRNATPERQAASDRWSEALGLRGTYHDAASGGEVEWHARRMPAGLVAFAGIGLIGGMFGLGAGWANVPALNLLMGVPLKLAVGTSGVAISIINSSAAWVYLTEGALLPILHVPSVLGVILGARVGARWLRKIQPATARTIVIGILLLAGARSLSKGLGY
jgi:uncharacterized membrane protein YfcA